MKNINIIIRKSFLFLFLILVGCSNFEDLNTNPDSSTKANASMTATGVILSSLKFNGRDAHAFLQPQAFAKYIGFANQSQMSQQYNEMGNGSFEGMTMLQNVEKMVQYATGTPTENSYKGIAKFARAYLFYHLTMQMGDIPYTDANKGETGLYRPKFDTQKDVLIGILDELKEADSYFSKGIVFDGDPTPYKGDPTKWRKASNAFALKVLMSLSKKEADPSLNIKARFAEIVNENKLLEESTGFLGLNYSIVDIHPLSGTNDLFTSRTVVSSLLIDELKRLNDRRLFYYAEPATKLINAGKQESDFNAYQGVDAALDYTVMTQKYLEGEYSLLNQRYLKDYASEPRMRMTYAEQQLILAEARILNWITVGDAKKYYESGVKSALKEQMKTKAIYAHTMAIDQAYIDNYFTGNVAFASTTGDQLKQIWYQRYILNFMQDATSSYFEYRRTNYPNFPVDPTTNLNIDEPTKIPVRWLYPTSESSYNRENYEKALADQYDGYDGVNKVMWVLK